MEDGAHFVEDFGEILRRARRLVLSAATHPRERSLAAAVASEIDHALAAWQGAPDLRAEPTTAVNIRADAVRADASGPHPAALRDTEPPDRPRVEAILPPPPPPPHTEPSGSATPSWLPPLGPSFTRDDLVAHIAHDLRTPLAAISLHAGSLAQRAGRATAGDEVRRSADSIRRSTARISRLVDELLEYSRLATGHVSLELRRAAPSDLIADAADVLAPLAVERAQRLIWQVRADAPDVVCDPDRVQQVLANLVGNAIKFTPQGGVITLATQSVEDGVEFSVQDTGPGLPDADLARVFDPYWQGSGAPRSGVGLGLAIVRAIVDAHGGRVGVVSAQGAGARFYFVLPAAR